MIPTAYTIGASHVIVPLDRQDVDADPRGIIWLWEPPRPRATYFMGVDPTIGVPNWHRAFRRDSDSKVDNGAITILRQGGDGNIPDVQVAEYAAPIDPEELADVANILGRLYGGNSEDNQCLSIIEIYPGPGLQTMRRMISVHGYTNQYVWTFLDTMVPKRTQALGWTATVKSVRDLWIRGSRFLHRGGVLVNSPWLIEEMCDAEMDMNKMTAKGAYGSHDDRLRALLLALWAAHHWSLEVETVREDVGKGEKVPNWQASDITADRMQDAWEHRFADLSEA